jgi:hypothetical protein
MWTVSNGISCFRRNGIHSSKVSIWLNPRRVLTETVNPAALDAAMMFLASSKWRIKSEPPPFLTTVAAGQPMFKSKAS